MTEIEAYVRDIEGYRSGDRSDQPEMADYEKEKQREVDCQGREGGVKMKCPDCGSNKVYKVVVERKWIYLRPKTS